MLLEDAKVGEQILIFLDSYDSVTYKPTHNQIPALVLDQDILGTTLGWKLGEVIPKAFYDVDLSDNWKQQGFIKAHRYSNQVLCLPINAMTKTLVPTEKPCKQCGRKNDLGVSKCWMCETLNPTI